MRCSGLASTIPNTAPLSPISDWREKIECRLAPACFRTSTTTIRSSTPRAPARFRRLCATQPRDCPTARFIANNGVHEYISQADVHEALSLTNVADYRRSSAALAQARAKAEIATRGLVVTVTQAYYGLVVAQRKYATAQRADAEAARFLDISQKLENGGEVAHADVIKARIQAQQQQRDLQEAQLAWSAAGLISPCCLFPDFNQDFAVVDDLQTPEPLPTFDEVEAAGKKNNPGSAGGARGIRSRQPRGHGGLGRIAARA